MTSNGYRAVVESQVPGRVRFRLPREERREDVVDSVQSKLRKLDGVVDITSNAETGSILVKHDPYVLSDSSLLSYARDANIIADVAGQVEDVDTAFPEASQLARSVLREFKQIDQYVSRLTGGRIDAKMAVVIILLLGAGIRALVGKKQVPAPWHALMWYSYSVFLHWHKNAKPQSS